MGSHSAAIGSRRSSLENEARKTLTQIVLGVFGLIVLYLTWRRVRASDRNVRVIEQGHITDRYTKAIEQLGKVEDGAPNIEVRLGGIYALERLAFDSPRDHWTIMEVLSAYVRRNAPWPPKDETNGAASEPRKTEVAPRTDIQAILTVLGRRHRGKKLERGRLDLSSCDLRGAKLPETHLEGANLIGAHLERADLTTANLEGAWLQEAHLERAQLWFANIERAYLKSAHLEGAYFDGANLEGADLTTAHLEGAWLQEVNLQGAHLTRANLQGAFLYKANLEGAIGLTIEQVKAAASWELAHYDAGFAAKLGLAGTKATAEQAKPQNPAATDPRP